MNLCINVDAATVKEVKCQKYYTCMIHIIYSFSFLCVFTVAFAPDVFEIGDPAFITCSGSSLTRWQEVEIKRREALSSVTLLKGSHFAGTLSFDDLPSNIVIVNQSATEDTFTVVLKIESVECRSVRTETYECLVTVDEDALMTSSSVIVQSKSIK